LIEAREDSVAVVGFELGVEVLSVVLLVDIGMQANLLIRVELEVPEGDGVPALPEKLVLEAEFVGGEIGRVLAENAVDGVLRDGLGLEVEEKVSFVLGHRLQEELHRRVSCVAVAFAHAQPEVVHHFLDVISFEYLLPISTRNPFSLLLSSTSNFLLRKSSSEFLRAFVRAQPFNNRLNLWGFGVLGSNT